MVISHPQPKNNRRIAGGRENTYDRDKCAYGREGYASYYCENCAMDRQGLMLDSFPLAVVTDARQGNFGINDAMAR